MEALIHPDLLSLAQPVDSLLNLPGNPRRGDVAAVSRSYQQFGQRKPIVARRGDRTVLAGNHQLLAARELGWDRIAVVFVDDDDVTAGAFALADNRTSDLGEYDVDDLLALLQSVHAEASADLFAATGFDNEDLLAMIAAAAPFVPYTDLDNVPPIPATPFSTLGDVWQLGPHRVVCGDAGDPDAYTALLGGEQADIVWTDPPYGVAIASRIGMRSKSSVEAKTHGGAGIKNDELSIPALTDFLRTTLRSTMAATRPGAAWYVAAPHGPYGVAFAITLGELEVWKHSLVWVKNKLVIGRADYHYMHEPIYYGWTPGGAHRWYGDRKQTTVLEFDRPQRSAEHPTMKPVDLIAYCLRNSSAPGEIVLDSFAGSGSTLMAANSTDRIGRMIELDPVYVDVICRRYQEHTGILPVLERTGEAHDFTTSN